MGETSWRFFPPKCDGKWEIPGGKLKICIQMIMSTFRLVGTNQDLKHTKPTPEISFKVKP